MCVCERVCVLWGLNSSGSIALSHPTFSKVKMVAVPLDYSTRVSICSVNVDVSFSKNMYLVWKLISFVLQMMQCWLGAHRQSTAE